MMYTFVNEISIKETIVESGMAVKKILEKKQKKD